MGDRAIPIVCFGFPLGAEEEVEIEGLPELIEATDNMEDKDWPVQLVAHGHHEYRHFMVAISGTVDTGGDWGDYRDVPSLPPEEHMIEAAKAWCVEHKIPWQEPAWSALAAYR